MQMTGKIIRYAYVFKKNYLAFEEKPTSPWLAPRLKYLLHSKKHQTLKTLRRPTSSTSRLCQWLMSPLRSQPPHQALISISPAHAITKCLGEKKVLYAK